MLADQLGPIEGPVLSVSASVAGLVASGEPAAIGAAVERAWPGARFVLSSDAVAAVMAAWGEHGGAVLAMGTGVVAFATDFSAVWQRSDGWGYLLGDEGGAAWIGARGISAALREFDHRPRGSSMLLDALVEQMGEPHGVPDLVRSAANSATALATFAPQVTSAAERGDHAAQRIIDDAIDHLVETGLSVLHDGVPPQLALVGGLAAVPLLAHGIITRANELRPEVSVITTPHSPLDGAIHFARLASRDLLPDPHPPYLYTSHSSITFHS